MSDLKEIFRKEHPLLSEPARWVLAGHALWSQNGGTLNRVPLEGTMRISHEGGKIVSHGEMNFVSRIDPIRFSTTYYLTPSADELVLDFYQETEEVGDLRGQVVCFDDRLVSSYTSGDGNIYGSEVFFRMGDYRYTVTGSLTHQGQVRNLWKLDLIKPRGTKDAAPGDENSHG